MNIFITDTDPTLCAQYLDDKRVVKMVLETAQMLSTAVRESGSDVPDNIYKSTHKNHPCNVWARESLSNYMWLCKHGLALCEEYTRRYNRRHKTQDVIETLYKQVPNNIPDLGLTAFANCAKHAGLGLDYGDTQDIPTAYRVYLLDRWATDKREPQWSTRTRPQW